LRQRKGPYMLKLIAPVLLLLASQMACADDYRVVDPIPLLTAGTMTGTAILTSSAIDVRSLGGALIYCVWTGTPNGTFSIQAAISNDSASFVDMGIAVNPATGTVGQRLIDINLSSIRFARVVYTNTSSTGVLNCSASAKTY
jgi:hypothetical protein